MEGKICLNYFVWTQEWCNSHKIIQLWKLKRRGKTHFMEIETGQSSGTELFYSLACGGSAWLTRHNENFRHFTYLKIYFKIYLKHPRIDFLFRAENYIRSSKSISALFDQTTQRIHPTLCPLTFIKRWLLYFYYLRRIIKYLVIN